MQTTTQPDPDAIADMLRIMSIDYEDLPDWELLERTQWAHLSERQARHQANMRRERLQALAARIEDAEALPETSTKAEAKAIEDAVFFLTH